MIISKASLTARHYRLKLASTDRHRTRPWGVLFRQHICFQFSMISDVAATIPILTTNTTEGLAFIIDVNPNGTTT
jgi:hypothetical protein